MNAAETLAGARRVGLSLVYYRTSDELGIRPASVARSNPDLLEAIREHKHEILRLSRAEREAFTSEAEVFEAFGPRAEPDAGEGEITLFLAERARWQRYSLRTDQGGQRRPATPPPDEHRDLSGEASESLAQAVADYLRRNPADAGEPAGWLAVTLWAHGLYPGKPTAAEVRDALVQMRGQAA